LRILTLTNEQVTGLADMKESVDEMGRAFGLLADGQVESPVRTRFKMSEVRNILLMPSLIRESKDTMSLKVVTVYPDLGPDVPSIRAAVLLLDGKDGALKCIMGGNSLTGIRTGAVSGLSCRYLGRKDSRRLGMIGAGGQGFYQISGVASQLGIKEVAVFDVDKGRQKLLVERCQKELGLQATAAETVHAAASGADVVVTATTSKTPVLDAQDVEPGTHIVAIGAYTPDARELGSALVTKASVFVDSMDAAMEEAGDILIPIKEGRMKKEDVKGQMTDLVSGKKARRDDDEITLFKAVGLAFEDNAIGWLVYDRALASGRGAWTDL
jgi:ornithine cyclodeaminase